jgi:hypothetical protein
MHAKRDPCRPYFCCCNGWAGFICEAVDARGERAVVLRAYQGHAAFSDGYIRAYASGARQFVSCRLMLP